MNLTPHKRELGTAIILVVSIMATLMVIVGVAAEYTSIINRHVQRTNILESAVAIGDGCIENMFARWREACRAQNNKELTTNDLATLSLPTQSQFPTVPNFTATRSDYDKNSTTTVQQCTVIAVDPELKPMPASATPTPGIGQNANTATYNYLATAYVTLPAVRGTLVAKVQRVLQKEQLSPWNYAIFYLDPLEIHPGPPFNVTGWVHTNSNLYTGHNTLNFLDKVTYGSDWKIGFKPGDPRDGTETPTSPTWPSNLPPALDVQHEPFGMDGASLFSTTDSNPNNDSYHELIEPPVSGYSDPLAAEPNQRYYNQAGVIIQISDNGVGVPSVTIMKPGGTVVNSSSTGADKNLYDMFNGAITLDSGGNQTIKDNRELANVRLTTLDISQIINSGTQNYKVPGFNGVVYITDTSAAANGVGAKRAIRLKNGAFIPAGGLTVASGNPVFIQGDFNTGTNPPSNSGDPTTPQASGYTRQPCSILGDAVYILSNAWTDGNAASDLSVRVASNTTVNAAIVSGIVPTNSNNNNKYSGGAENFPRFNENWSNKTLTYYGSMIELFNSRQAIGNWGNDNVYVPPIRKWYFDNNFKTSTPPGSLMIYNYVKGRWSLVP